MKKVSSKVLASVGLFALLASSCEPNPRRQLNVDERVADVMWLTSKIEANYAPLQYKEELHGFDYETIKEQYIELAKKDQTNEAFYLLMQRFVAELKDGHVSASLTRSDLAGRSELAFVGFVGHRHGDNFLVKAFAPTFTASGDYPIKANDEIVEFNGMPLKEAVDKIVKPYRNVGNEQANYTILMQSLFIRNSLTTPMPEDANVTLKVKRNSKTFEVEVPWVVDDYAKFTERQKLAVASIAQAKGIDYQAEEKKAKALVKLAGLHPYVTQSFIKNALSKLKGKTTLDSNELLTELSDLNVGATFEFQNPNALGSDLNFYQMLAKSIQSEASATVDPIKNLKKDRYVPTSIFPVASAKTYPAYVSIETKDNVRQAVGYIRINTFSPEGDEGNVIKEFKKTLKFFRDFGATGVNKVVIDLIDNGGGSLSLGLKMAALLSSETIKIPGLQYMLNDSWMDQYQSLSYQHVNDAARVMADRAYQDMLGMFQNGERLSNNYSAHSLFPFSITPNPDMVLFDKAYDFEIAVVTNEMCASMCDIFSSILKENKMATFIGEQTMGAGGNVVNHAYAPNSGLKVSLTESLIVSSSGEYLENNGVKPDVQMEVNKYKKTKYQEVIKKGFELLTE